MHTKLDKFGRVLIPKNIRKNLGLKPGDTLELEHSQQEIIIKPNSKNDSRSKKLEILEKLFQHNQRFNLEISPGIDISNLADEVNL